MIVFILFHGNISKKYLHIGPEIILFDIEFVCCYS